MPSYRKCYPLCNWFFCNIVISLDRNEQSSPVLSNGLVLYRSHFKALTWQSNWLSFSLVKVLAKFGVKIVKGLLEGSWFFARNPVWVLRETESSVLSNLRCSASMAKAWISLTRFAVVIIIRNAVFIVRCSREALCKGSYGSLHIEERTHARSHLGAKDLWIGLWISKALIS